MSYEKRATDVESGEGVRYCTACNKLLPRLQITEKHLLDLASCLVDGTVFDIVRELEEIQQLNERSLLNKRVKVAVTLVHVR